MVSKLERAFAGRSALVTGGGSGIGLAIGELLARSGARVVLADIDSGEVADAAERIAATGPPAEVRGVWLDVVDRDAFREVVDDIVEQSGGLDLLFNNAGISMGGPTHELSGEHWDRIIDVNLKGVVNGLLAAYPRMVEARAGQIINTASGVGLAAPPFVVPYAATKHAVVGMSLGLRPEAALHGVGVTVLCPGAVDTAILDRPPPADLPATTSAPVTARAYLAALGQKPVPVETFAARALRKVADRRQAVIVVPSSAKALWYLQRLSPAVTGRLTASLARKVNRALIRPAS